MSQEVDLSSRLFLDLINFYGKIGSASSAAAKRLVVKSLPSLASKSSAPSLNAEVVKLNDCEEECDEKPREALFAFRSTDLSSWASSSAGSTNTDSDPTTIQHWAVVVHFPRGKKTYLFEAWKDDDGKLQPGRAEIAFKEIEIFVEATYFGIAVTSPSELLIKANQIPTGRGYDVFVNNCQTWLKDFLDCVSPELLVSLYEKVPDTETYLSYRARQLQKLSKISSKRIE